jgi:hypothetical protein
MKNLNLKIGLLVLSLLGSSFAMADEATSNSSSSTGLRLGVEAGFDLANFNGGNANDVFASRLGFVGGGFLDLPLGSILAIQPEVLYAQKGGKYNGNAYQENYVEVPVLLNINVVGPVAILLGPSFDMNVFNNGLNNVNNTDVGLVGGVQLNISQLMLSGRYEIGLTDVNTTQHFQNGTFTLMAGLSLI